MSLNKPPLQRLRVLDFGQVWAIPLCGKWLASMGAQVIQIESHHHPNSIRFGDYADNKMTETYWETSGRFHALNMNKKNLCIDYTVPHGKALVERIVESSDIVMENFRPGVMDKLGLGYEHLKKTKKDIIMISASGYGAVGPRSQCKSYGPSLQAMSGLVSVTGYKNEEPSLGSLQYIDVHAAIYCLIAILAALYHRQKTGEGQYLDLAQYEAAVETMAIPLMDYLANGRVAGTSGNELPGAAPCGCYPCQGDDRWLTIAIATEKQWAAFCQTIGNPPWASESRFSNALERYNHREELDTLVKAWTITQDQQEAMAKLQSAGVPAGAVLNTKDLLLNDHLRFRQVFHKVNYTGKRGMEGVGVRMHQSTPVRFSKTPCLNPKPAPSMGEHNAAVLAGILGLTADEIADLAKSGIIGDRIEAAQPAGALQINSLELLKKQGIIKDYDPDFQAILGIK